jgi:hypothetical protein
MENHISRRYSRESTSRAGLGLPTESGSVASSSSALAFITFSNPQDVKATNNRHIIRSHALKDFHAKKRQQLVLQHSGVTQKQQSQNIATKSDEDRVNNRDHLLLMQCSCGDTHHGVCSVSQKWHLCPSESTCRSLAPAPIGLLGAGRIDPFSSYPRPLSTCEHLLVDYCKHCININNRHQRLIGLQSLRIIPPRLTQHIQLLFHVRWPRFGFLMRSRISVCSMESCLKLHEITLIPQLM